MASTISLSWGAYSADFSPGNGVYEFANNPTTGQGWTPTAATPQTLLSGGAPFATEALIASESYQNVTETIAFQIKGATHNAVVASLQALRRILYGASEYTPGQLLFQPNSATRSVIFLIWQGWVQEDYRFIHDEAGRGTLRGMMTIRRSVWGDRDSSFPTYSSSVSIGNAPNTAPTNLIAFSSLLGDRIHNGQPLEVRLASAASGMFASAGIQRAYLATTLRSTRNNIATAMTTSSTTGTTIATSDFTAPSVAYRHNVRVCARITSPSSNLELQVQVIHGTAAAGSGAAIWTSAWIAPGTSTTYVDFGFHRYPTSMEFAGGAAVRILLMARSTTGGAVSGTWADVEQHVYVTWCRITSTISLTAPTLRIRSTTQMSGVGGAIVLPTPYVAFETSSQVPLDMPEVRGTLPVAQENYNFMVVALTGTTHDSSDTGTLSLDYMPQYTTWIGNN
jgi:hypothetical protein